MEAKTISVPENQLLQGDRCERRQIKRMHSKRSDILSDSPSPFAGIFCGSVPPGPVLLNNSQDATVLFSSDVSRAGSGFVVRHRALQGHTDPGGKHNTHDKNTCVNTHTQTKWTLAAYKESCVSIAPMKLSFYAVLRSAGAQSGCGSIVLVQDPSPVRSPNHPQLYAHDCVLRWVVHAPRGHVVKVGHTFLPSIRSTKRVKLTSNRSELHYWPHFVPARLCWFWPGTVGHVLIWFPHYPGRCWGNGGDR